MTTQASSVQSQPCETCRKRKKKCDRRVPTCGACLKSGWPCEGNRPRFLIVDQGAKQAQLRQRDSKPARPECALFAQPQLSPTDQLRAEFCARLIGRDVTATFEIFPAHRLLKHVPRRLGSSIALDEAVACICPGGTSRSELWGPSQAQDARRRYVKALKSLQAALNDSTTSTTSETLAAITLLQMYEAKVDHQGAAWVQHAKGAIRLIELRGPQAVKHDLDWAIFEAELGNIVFESIFDGKECFLSGEAWRALLSNPRSALTMFPNYVGMVGVFSLFPGILKDYMSSASTGRCLCSSLGDIQGILPGETAVESEKSRARTDLYQRCSLLRSQLLDWRALKPDVPANLASSAASQLDEATRVFVFSVDLGINAVSTTMLILITHIMVQLGFDISDADASSSLRAVNDDQRFYQDAGLITDGAEWTFDSRVMRQDYQKVKEWNELAFTATQRAMKATWRKVTALHFEPTHICKDPVLRATGDISTFEW